MTDVPRVLPVLDPDTRFFWTSGRDGVLRIARCTECRYYIHPPAPVCPRCSATAVEPEAVSGRATVFAVTVNHQAWTPGFREPYAMAVVELPEQPGLRLTTAVVGCPADDVRIGMDVTVAFEDHDPVFLPLFVPART
ncbi:hypothetical protein GCM10009836_44230 [Pseudonocardia ailaonensis]|uniref:DNA-binding protein n=1 Tax=Pseudonocardia ailaonensis TaxID=367279 RepID=A0ABN2N9J3_9PSEU